MPSMFVLSESHSKSNPIEIISWFMCMPLISECILDDVKRLGKSDSNCFLIFFRLCRWNSILRQKVSECIALGCELCANICELCIFSLWLMVGWALWSFSIRFVNGRCTPLDWLCRFNRPRPVSCAQRRRRAHIEISVVTFNWIQFMSVSNAHCAHSTHPISVSISSTTY